MAVVLVPLPCFGGTGELLLSALFSPVVDGGAGKLVDVLLSSVGQDARPTDVTGDRRNKNHFNVYLSLEFTIVFHRDVSFSKNHSLRVVLGTTIC